MRTSQQGVSQGHAWYVGKLEAQIQKSKSSFEELGLQNQKHKSLFKKHVAQNRWFDI